MDYIFDLYGTLADICTDEAPDAFWACVAQDAARYGARYTGETLKKTYLALCADEVRRRSATLPGVPEEFVEPELLNVFSRLLSGRDDDAAAFARTFRRRSTRWLRPMPYAAKVLDALRKRGARMFLLSNAQACFTNDELLALGFSDRFNGILLSSDAGMKKPYRGLFELMLDRYAIDRGAAVMVGNDAVADIGGAHAAGLCCRYYHTWQSGPRPASLPDDCLEIPDLSALL